MRLWDGQAGAAGLSGARQSGKGQISHTHTHTLVVLTWAYWANRCIGASLVWESSNHHDALQLHQTGEGPAFPCPDEREGGHTVVHRAGAVSSLSLTHTHTHTTNGPAGFPPTGSSASLFTTPTCPTWVAALGRSFWDALGASPSSGTSLRHSRTTLPVNNNLLKAQQLF